MFAISIVEAITSRITPTRKTIEITPPTRSTRFEVLPPLFTSSTPGGAGFSWSLICEMYSPCLGVIS